MKVYWSHLTHLFPILQCIFLRSRALTQSTRKFNVKIELTNTFWPMKFHIWMMFFIVFSFLAQDLKHTHSLHWTFFSVWGYLYQKKRKRTCIHFSAFNKEHWWFWRILTSYPWDLCDTSSWLDSCSPLTLVAFVLSTLYLAERHGVDLCGCYWVHTAHLVELAVTDICSVNTVFFLYNTCHYVWRLLRSYTYYVEVVPNIITKIQQWITLQI